MCGNFGLLLLKSKASAESSGVDLVGESSASRLDSSIHAVMQRVASVHGLRLEEAEVKKRDPILDVLTILEAQTANTELRGGQAGGFSSISFPLGIPSHSRVRCVARKRHPLSRDLASMFHRQRASSSTSSSLPSGDLDDFSDINSVIGHTRFATSSVNTVSELHPHEWSAFAPDSVWRFSCRAQKLEKLERALCGLHLTHNGDFDALQMYGETLTVNGVGLWLEKVLHVPNLLLGDSPKLAGCMELFVVQGRWNRAARLAYVRTVLSSSGDVCDGPLTREAPSRVPDERLWSRWSSFFESVWATHGNNVIKNTMRSAGLGGGYTIDRKGEASFVEAMVSRLSLTFTSQGDASIIREREELRCGDLSATTLHSFLISAVRGFLRADAYSALTELLSRAEGSFGVQVHSPCEPGVVVIASKGQPMSLAFDPASPLVLFGSEATALTVSVTSTGQWLSSRVDLESQGEVVRVGCPRELMEGTFAGSKNGSQELSRGALQLQSGIEIRIYSIPAGVEYSRDDILARAKPVVSVPVPVTLGADLVSQDLQAIPAVIAAIDQAWADADLAAAKEEAAGAAARAASQLSPSSEARTASALTNALLASLTHRASIAEHSMLDLVISGVEVSLWAGEQFAADLRMIFPQINVAVVSSNKLLGLGHLSPERTFFPGDACDVEGLIDPLHTVCLLISQSGQTFPTLHAAFRLADFIQSNHLWLVTGTFGSKIENVIVGECFKKRGVVYEHDRVFNNYSGHRPAEPSSVAAVATWHTLSHLLLFLVEAVKEHNAKVLQDEDEDGVVAMLLSEGCIGDFRSLLLENTVQNLTEITQAGECTNGELVAHGKLWGAHIAEPWNILVFAGAYIILSVGLGLPLFGLLGDMVAAIIRACGVDLGEGSLADSSPRHMVAIHAQPLGWTLVGFALNIADALFFVFLCKIFTWGDRWLKSRALGARMGKRTLVIVDQPGVHCLLQNFVSKLYAQAYSFLTPEVQSACGQDEFVHVFTHRVARGLLLAVGRPDGRLGCLSKSESSVLLATKQAAFIRNPAYPYAGSAPEVLTLSHNPFVPAIPGTHLTIRSRRRQFLEEVLYDKLHQDQRPFTAGILRSLAHDVLAESEHAAGAVGAVGGQPEPPLKIGQQLSSGNAARPPLGAHLILSDSLHGSSASMHGVGSSTHGPGPGHGHLLRLPVHSSHSSHGGSSSSSSSSNTWTASPEAMLATIPPRGPKDTPFHSLDPPAPPVDVFYNAREARQARTHMTSDLQSSTAPPQPPSDDPHARLLFSLKTDTTTREVQDQEHVIQSLYEDRIAALERFVSFCVVFHAMAKSNAKPLLLTPWDTSRSQSYLRVATTASPVGAVEGGGRAHSTAATQKLMRELHRRLRRVNANF